MRTTATTAAALLLASASSCGAANSTSDVAPIVEVRDSGYLLGDLIDERVRFELPEGLTLDAAALPAPGRVAPWLELRHAAATRAGRVVDVVLSYQIFAEVEQASRVPIPAFSVPLAGAGQGRKVEVPEASFLLSPALPPTLTDEDRELKPSPAPSPIPLAAPLVRLAAAVTAALLAILYLLWQHDRLPFLPRRPGPFARLWRRWRRRARRPLPVGAAGEVQRDWHVALNDSAGQTLYAATLVELFARAPHLAPMRERLEAAFARSWSSLYGNEAAPDAADLLELAREAALRERGVPC